MYVTVDRRPITREILHLSEDIQNRCNYPIHLFSYISNPALKYTSSIPLPGAPPMQIDNRPDVPIGDSDDSPKFCVALAFGTEGPYTCLELRQMLSTGRIKPDDRVIQEGLGHSAMTVADLIPDAREVATHVERVRRRSTSGEHRAQRTGSSSEIRRYRDSTDNATPISESIPVMRPRPDAIRLNRRASIVIIILTLLIAVLSVLLIAETGIFDGSRPQPSITRWRIADLGKLGGPWTFTLNGSSLITEGPNGEIITSNADIQREDDYHTIITLSPAHPALGSSVTISASAEIEVQDKNAKGIGQPEPEQ